MRKITWFTNESKREAELRQAKYYKMMFPFGEQQRAKELELLHAFIDTRMRDADLMYQFVCAKECLAAEDEETWQLELNDWKSSTLGGRLSESDRHVLLALAFLEKDCKSLEDFPDIETLRKALEMPFLEFFPSL